MKTQIKQLPLLATQTVTGGNSALSKLPNLASNPQQPLAPTMPNPIHNPGTQPRIAQPSPICPGQYITQAELEHGGKASFIS